MTLQIFLVTHFALIAGAQASDPTRPVVGSVAPPLGATNPPAPRLPQIHSAQDRFPVGDASVHPEVKPSSASTALLSSAVAAQAVAPVQPGLVRAQPIATAETAAALAATATAIQVQVPAAGPTGAPAVPAAATIPAATPVVPSAQGPSTTATPTLKAATVIVPKLHEASQSLDLPAAASNTGSWLSILAPHLAQILAQVNFGVIVKALCMAGNVLVQISPYPQVKRWERRSSTGEADAAPYLSIAFGGWQWCFYGAFAWLLTKQSGFLILVHSNCLGALLGTYYTIAFWRNCRSEHSVDNFHRYLSAVLALVLLQLCGLLVMAWERALFLTGIVSSFCSFVGAISMLITVPTVLNTKDSRSIPGPLVVANFLSAMVWCLCGYMLSDPLVIGPNVVACMASAACLYLKFKFPSELEEDLLQADSEQKVPLRPVGNAWRLEHDDAALERASVNECTPLTKGIFKGIPHPLKQFGTLATTMERDHAMESCADGTGGTC